MPSQVSSLTRFLSARLPKWWQTEPPHQRLLWNLWHHRYYAHVLYSLSFRLPLPLTTEAYIIGMMFCNLSCCFCLKFNLHRYLFRLFMLPIIILLFHLKFNYRMLYISKLCELVPLDTQQLHLAVSACKYLVRTSLCGETCSNLFCVSFIGIIKSSLNFEQKPPHRNPKLYPSYWSIHSNVINA